MKTHNKPTYSHFTLPTTLAILLMSTFTAFAQSPAGDGEFSPPTDSREIVNLIISVADWIMIIVLPFLALAIIWAGFKIVSARGNEASLSTAKATLLWSVVGAIIVIAAPTLARIIVDIFRF